MVRANSQPVANAESSTIHLPAPTAWPIVLAFGVTLLLAGLVTSESVSILGAILFVTASAGWFPAVLPQEKKEMIEVRAEAVALSTSRGQIDRLAVAPDLPRAVLPLEAYPVSAGIKGGRAGG